LRLAAEVFFRESSGGVVLVFGVVENKQILVCKEFVNQAKISEFQIRRKAKNNSRKGATNVVAVYPKNPRSDKKYESGAAKEFVFSGLAI
jgi:hypothetical protein